MSKKPKLRCNTVTRIETNAYDVEAFIINVYDKDSFSIQWDQECGDDVSIHIEVNGVLDDEDQAWLMKFVREGQQDNNLGILDILMNDCASKGLIAKGNYLVRGSFG